MCDVCQPRFRIISSKPRSPEYENSLIERTPFLAHSASTLCLAFVGCFSRRDKKQDKKRKRLLTPRQPLVAGAVDSVSTEAGQTPAVVAPLTAIAT